MTNIRYALNISQRFSISLNVSQCLSMFLNVSQYLSTHLKTSIMSLNASGCLSILLAIPPLLLFIPRAVQEMIQDLRVHLRGVKTWRRKVLTTVNETESPTFCCNCKETGHQFGKIQKGRPAKLQEEASWKIFLED